MQYEREMGDAFKLLFKDHCVPEKMLTDGARSQVKGSNADVCNNAGFSIIELEHGTPSSN